MRFIHSVFVRGGLAAALAAILFASSAVALGQSEWVVHSFAANGSQGTAPYGNLVADSAGNLYGTTSQGGAFAHGNVYELKRPVPPKTTWTQTTLYSFTGGVDGSAPFAGLVFDKAGNLYGTTLAGGGGLYGTVFELKPPATEPGDWTESVLYSFAGTSKDGAQPYGGVVLDSSGNLYGTTIGTVDSGHFSYGGTVFELEPPAAEGGEWTESVLYYFDSSNFASGNPMSSPILDAKGNLHGTASTEGHNNGGALWRLTRPATPGGTWLYRSLYSFGGGTGHFDPSDGYALG